MAGLAGSVVHCTAMCGPFVLGQVADGMARMPAHRLCEAARLRQASLLPYHAGRLATYTALGSAAGWLGSVRLPGYVPGLLLALAGGAFLLLAAQRLQPAWAAAGLPRQASRPTTSFATGFGHRLTRAARGGGLKLGLVLGLLPCGMVYAALAAAAAGGPVLGGLGMLAFGLGTVPALVAVGLLGHVAARRWQGAADRVAPFVLAGNALLLLTLAARSLGPEPHRP